MLDLYLDEITHSQYIAFIDYIFKKSDRISFHFPNFDVEDGTNEIVMNREYARYLKKCENVIDFMWEYKIEERLSNEHGMSTFGYLTTVWVVRLENAVANFLKERAGFEEWQYPYAPEDLCVYERGTSNCWMATVAHEGIARIYRETPEDIRFFNELQISYEKTKCFGLPRKKKIPNYRKSGEYIQQADSLEQFWKSVNKELEKPMTLCEACERGEYQVVEKLVQEGADVNIVDEEGKSPLELAIHSFEDWECNSESYKIVKMIIVNGADMNYKNQWGESVGEMVSQIFLPKTNGEFYDTRKKEIFQIYQMVVELTGKKPTFSEAINAVCTNNLLILEYIESVVPEIFHEVDCEGKNILENALSITEGEDEDDINKIITFLIEKTPKNKKAYL